MIDELVTRTAGVMANILLDMTTRISPVYILITIGIAYGLYRTGKSRTEPSFWRWLAPRRIYLHPSHITDIKLFILGSLLGFAGLFKAPLVRTAASVGTVALVAGTGEIPVGDWGTGMTLLATVAIVLVNDFCVYWTHRLHHESPALWPFHAVHHSAEVMTPLTLYRKHPVYDLIAGLVRALGGGIIFGLLLALIGTGVDVLAVGGANILYVLFSALGGNLRHSHIWLAYPGWLEHLLISPAQHQIHHSRAPEHYNKNYGEVFALWDWWFGSLHLSGPEQTLQFGLNDESGAKLSQPHPTLTSALLVPLRDARRSLRSRTDASQQDDTITPVRGEQV